MAIRRNPATKPAPTKRQLARWERERRRQRIIVIVAAVVIALVMAIPAYGYYVNYIAPPSQTIVKVGNKGFGLGYVAQRLILSYNEAESLNQRLDVGVYVPRLLDSIESEEQILQGASSLGLEASSEEITAQMRRRSSFQFTFSRIENPTDEGPDADVAYKTLLSQSDFPESEYQRVARAWVLRDKLGVYLVSNLPAQADQVHVRAILVKTAEEADDLKAKLAGGEDFSSLAKGNSLDTLSRDGGGDMDWLPRGIMSTEFDEVVFSLEPKTLSNPIATQEGYYLVEMLEKEAGRALSEGQSDGLKRRAVQLWIARQGKAKGVERNWNNEKYLWVVNKLTSHLKAKAR